MVPPETCAFVKRVKCNCGLLYLVGMALRWNRRVD